MLRAGVAQRGCGVCVGSGFAQSTAARQGSDRDLQRLALELDCGTMKWILLALIPLAALGSLHAEEASKEKTEEGKRHLFGYPERAATTKEILNTGIYLQHKDGSRTPYVPEHTTLKGGAYEFFFVWEMNPLGGSAVWLGVEGYTRTKRGWERFLSTRFEGIFGMAPSIDEKRKMLILSEREDPNPGATQEMFYARLLNTMRSSTQ